MSSENDSKDTVKIVEKRSIDRGMVWPSTVKMAPMPRERTPPKPSPSPSPSPSSLSSAPSSSKERQNEG